MNREFRNDFRHRVNAARQGGDGRISQGAFDKFDVEARTARKAGVIDALDYVNCRALIGEAVNLPRSGGSFSDPIMSDA